MVVDIIPAIDLKDGEVVRLRQGLDDQTTKYPGDPVAVAREWVQLGAQRIHVVNLDGAFGRVSRNSEVIQRICKEVRASVECGGGIRSIRDAERALQGGCAKIVVGTIAIEHREVLREILRLFGTGRVVVALDTKGGKMTTKGWTVTSEHGILDVARELRDVGVSEILHTNIMHDGMMVGPDTDTLQILGDTGIKVIASGGISSHQDVHKLVGLRLANLTGIIIGRALYEKKIRLDVLLKELADAQT
jgi:phosphoribosylformimino-5-aminoimidazole carboxamide ribotide isomerase